VKAWGRWLADEGYMADPFAKVRRPKAVAPPKTLLQPADVDALLKLCRQDGRTEGLRNRAILLLLWSTGLRLAELCGLRADDIDLNGGMALVRKGKGGKPRTIPLTHKVATAIERYWDRLAYPPTGTDAAFLTQDGRPMPTYAVQLMLVRLGKRAGVKANPHLWRHSSATAYLRAGGKLETLRVLLGHSRLDQTLGYAQIAGIDVTNDHRTADPARLLKGR
jgi:integrase/recombinase XerC